MRKCYDIDVELLNFDELCIQLGKISLVRLIVHIGTPVAGVTEVMKTHTDCHLALRRDVRGEAAAQDCNVSVWR